VVDRITLVAADLVLLHAALTLAVAMVVVALRVAVAPPTSRVGGPVTTTATIGLNVKCA
jgi:hypothetical protein